MGSKSVSRVFITDGHWRKTLAATRALGMKGISVTVGESARLSATFFSRYCNRSVVYPSPLNGSDAFVDFLRRELSRSTYRMILPMEDETLALVSRNIADFSRLTYVPVVSFEKLKFVQDKWNVLKLAKSKGIPIPRTWYINDLSELTKLSKSIPFPAVIKSREEHGAMGVAYAKDAHELEEKYLAVHKYSQFPLIQERIPLDGPGYGASFLFNEVGEIKASFIHKRLREYPITGGASTLRESVKHDDIRNMAAHLLKSIGWFGVAMVEFKLDPRDGIPKLMEINPRFWGSLALAIEAGVNFPYLLYKMACGEKFDPIENYEVGKKCRWLLPGDILHFIYNPQRMKLSPSFFDFWDQNTAYDDFSFKDPLPALGIILTPITFLYDQDMKKRLATRRKWLRKIS